jgi:hypothetical protein
MKSHHELRFSVTLEKALRVRDFVREYMDFDQYSVGQPDFSYSVHTVYLDSDDWKLYWRTIRGDQDRWKLRLRYYDDRPDSPVFCEVKHQMTDVIVKYRGGLKRKALPGLLAGEMPHPSQFVSQTLAESEAFERFLALTRRVNAKPRLHTAFRREGHESDSAKERVTLDRSICISEVCDDLLSMHMDNPLICSTHTVILGMRFTERFPDWYREMVRIFELSERSLWEHNQGTIACAGLLLREDEVISNIVL